MTDGDRFFATPVTWAVANHVARFGPDVGEPVVTGPAGTWATFDRAAGLLAVRDTRGVVQHEHRFADLPGPGARRSDGFAFHLATGEVRMAHLQRDRVVVRDGSGIISEHPHVPWGSIMGAAVCFAAGGAEVWAALPAIAGAFQATSGQLVRIDARTGQAMDRFPLDDAQPEGYDLLRHPTQEAALLDGSYGQDGTDEWTVVVDDGAMHVRPVGRTDRITGSFSPDGTRFVTAPHDVDDLLTFSWPDAEVVHQVRSRDVFAAAPADGDPDEFFYRAAFLTDRLVLARTYHGRLLLIDDDQPARVQQVLLAGYAGADPDLDEATSDEEGDLQWFDVVAPGTVLTHHGDGHLDLWSIGPAG